MLLSGFIRCLCFCYMMTPFEPQCWCDKQYVLVTSNCNLVIAGRGKGVQRLRDRPPGGEEQLHHSPCGQWQVCYRSGAEATSEQPAKGTTFLRTLSGGNFAIAG